MRSLSMTSRQTSGWTNCLNTDSGEHIYIDHATNHWPVNNQSQWGRHNLTVYQWPDGTLNQTPIRDSSLIATSNGLTVHCLYYTERYRQTRASYLTDRWPQHDGAMKQRQLVSTPETHTDKVPATQLSGLIADCYSGLYSRPQTVRHRSDKFTAHNCSLKD